jgi:hypothetical protein
VVPLSAECRHLARELLDAMQKLSDADWSASARERRRGDGLGVVVCTAGCSFQLNLRLADESCLNVGGG